MNIYFGAIKKGDQEEFQLLPVTANNLQEADQIVLARLLANFYDAIDYDDLMIDGFRLFYPSLIHAVLINEPDLETMPLQNMLQVINDRAVLYLSNQSIRMVPGEGELL